MQVKIIIFGQLCEILGEILVMDKITDTESLQLAINKKFPELKNYQYVMAVNKKQVTINTVLNEHSTVALLPPFSGG